MHLTNGTIQSGYILTVDKYQIGIYYTVTGNYTIGRHCFFLHVEISISFRHHTADFNKTVCVNKRFNPLFC